MQKQKELKPMAFKLVPVTGSSDDQSVVSEDEMGDSTLALGQASGALLFAPILNELRRAEIAN